MKTGISTASFFTKVPTEACFDELRKMDVKLTEVFLSSYSEYEKSFVDALVPRLGEIKVHSVHALSNQFEGELFSQSRRVKDDAEALFRRVCYAGNALGAKYYTFHGQNNLKKGATINVPYFAEKLSYLAEIASTYGLKIAVENVYYCKFASPDVLRELLTACPALVATLDVKHAYYAGYDVNKYLDAVGDKLVTLHVTDVTANGETALPGDGRLNFEKLFKEIDKRGLEPAVILEAYPRDYSFPEQLATAYSRIKDAVNNL